MTHAQADARFNGRCSFDYRTGKMGDGTEPLSPVQHAALQGLALRGMGAVCLPLVGWVWPVDIRNSEAIAEVVVAHLAK